MMRLEPMVVVTQAAGVAQPVLTPTTTFMVVPAGMVPTSIMAAPAPTLPPGWSPPPAPPSGIELSVCGNDGDEANGRDLVPWFTVTFMPRSDAGMPAGPLRVDDRSCQLIPFPLHPGDYRILVMAPGWGPETWDETVVLGSSMGTVFVGLRPIGVPRPVRPTPAPFTPPSGVD